LNAKHTSRRNAVPEWFGFTGLPNIRPWRTRSISAENPTGAPGGGARANVGDDIHTTQAASELGRGWKVRPCLRIRPGETHTLADIEGPGVVQHIWMTVDPSRARQFRLRIYYDSAAEPAIECPVCDFFCNGIDGRAKIASLPIAVNPAGGMNSYWPMPFRRRLRITISNDWPTPHPTHPLSPLEEFFYQITWSEQPVDDDAGYLHAEWRRTTTMRDHPEFTILAAGSARGPGHYAGTYLIWRQHSEGWWGEGEVKFFIDGDIPPPSQGGGKGVGQSNDNAGTVHPHPHPPPQRGGGNQFPTICGTGTEDYFGGAWGFEEKDAQGIYGPLTYSTAFLGYPQALIDERPRIHGLYRWHIPDPIRFQQSLRVTCQALGWWPTGTYQPLTDDITSVAYWYQRDPSE
jgi:hypothetical protein